MKLKGAQIITEVLSEQKITTVFGYPGSTVLSLYDALYEKKDQITHILTADEQGAAHAASGYAKASGNVGVVTATSGPGATNLITGIAAAYMDSVPLVAITGNVPLKALGTDSFQEVDIFGISTPVTKYSMIADNSDTLADDLRRAFKIAQSGRPGPVLIDIPSDVLEGECDYKKEDCNFSPSLKKADDSDIKAVYEEIANAEKPLIFAGGGVISSGASDILKSVSEKFDIPVISTMMGLGCVDSDFEKFLGFSGTYGLKNANDALKNSDLLIAAGVRFSDRVLTPKARVIHIDIDSAELNKNIKASLGICADIKDFLERLISFPELKHPSAAKKSDPEKSIRASEKIIDELSEFTTADTVIATDVGNHQLLTASRYPFKNPRTFITSGGLGAMGFGLGAAIGAYIATKKQTVLITGDSSFLMNMSELATVSKYCIPVKIIVMDNSVMGLVHRFQQKYYGSRFYQTEPHRNINYKSLADAFSIKEIEYASKKSTEEFMTCDGPCILHCKIPKEE